MREFHIGKNDEKQRLDRFLGKAVPLLPASLAQKYIRLKRIKVNGARAQRDQKLCAGDVLQCYINDEFFETPSEENVYLTITTPRLKIVYEDENIMLLDKPAGLVVHADEREKVNTLVNHMLAYLYQKREWKPREENAFTPALCNRIHLKALGESTLLLPHAEEVCRTLSRTHRLYIVTNAVASVQRSRLHRSAVAPYITDAFISEEAGASKPSRAYFNYVFARILGITRENCLLIGDSPSSDIRGANNADIPCCWYDPHGTALPEGLLIDYRITDLRQLYDIV